MKAESPEAWLFKMYTLGAVILFIVALGIGIGYASRFYEAYGIAKDLAAELRVARAQLEVFNRTCAPVDSFDFEVTPSWSKKPDRYKFQINRRIICNECHKEEDL